MRKLAIVIALTALPCSGCLSGNGPAGAGQPTFTSVVPTCYPNCPSS